MNITDPDDDIKKVEETEALQKSSQDDLEKEDDIQPLNKKKTPSKEED